MIHIRQKNSNAECYTVVKTDAFQGPLDQHPCLLENPDVFELVDGEVPSDAQYLDYSTPEE